MLAWDGYQMVSLQNGIGSDRRTGKSNIQDNHSPNCFLQ